MEDLKVNSIPVVMDGWSCPICKNDKCEELVCEVPTDVTGGGHYGSCLVKGELSLGYACTKCSIRFSDPIKFNRNTLFPGCS